jgi:transcription termination factor Rho
MLKDTENARTLTLNDPAVERDGAISKVVSRGQVSYFNEEWVLLPEDGSFPEKKVPISVSLIERHKLREGDGIACYFPEKDDWQRVEVIISINGVGVEMLKDRPNFEECNVCYAQKRINVFEGGKNASLSHKCVEWLFPITCGQRACVVSSPKAGKTRILRELAQAVKRLNPHAEVLVLLCDQTPETVAEFTRIYGDRGLVYTTYEDDADRQVYVAEWVLKRAKRYAEMGRTVVLFVDSLTALARAFNDTEASMGGKTLPCGLEVKTVHYLKKYFGTARCLEKGGCITIFGALNIGSGNPMDDIIARELSALATLKLELSDELAIRRIYPAIDFEKSSGNYDAFVEGLDAETEILLRNKVLPRIGSQGVLNLIEESNSKEEFIEKIKKIANG